MKTTIITTIIAVVLFLYAAKLKISFKPFSVSMEFPYLFLGWICIGIAVVLFGIHYDKIGYKRGVEDARDAVIQLIEEGKTKNKNDENH